MLTLSKTPRIGVPPWEEEAAAKHECADTGVLHWHSELQFPADPHSAHAEDNTNPKVDQVHGLSASTDQM